MAEASGGAVKVLGALDHDALNGAALERSAPKVDEPGSDDPSGGAMLAAHGLVKRSATAARWTGSTSPSWRARSAG